MILRRRRGTFAAACIEDRQANPIPIGEHLRVPEADHAITETHEMLGPSLVVGDLIAVLTTVYLDDQQGLRAEEVDDVRLQRDLTLPSPTAKPAVPEHRP